MGSGRGRKPHHMGGGGAAVGGMTEKSQPMMKNDQHSEMSEVSL